MRFCGKKTPLVRRKRRRRQTVRHDSPGAAEAGPDPLVTQDGEVQVHPMAVEAALPLGKKVRLGENRKRKKKKSSSSTSKTQKDSLAPTAATAATPATEDDDDWRSTTQGAVTRAARLAANLSQLIVNLPPEGNEEEPDEEAVKASEAKRRREDVPKRSRQAHQKRASKSLSPEKTIAAGIRRSRLLADSVNSISKSFEKLENIGQIRRKRRLKHHRPKEQQEMTIAKLGPFKFSLEVKPSASDNLAKAKEAERRRERKRSAVVVKDATKTTVEKKSNTATISTKPEKVDREDLIKPKTAEETSEQKVIVSRKHQGDRPLRARPIKNDPTKAKADQELLLKLLSSMPPKQQDYRQGFLNPAEQKFSRSVSYPETKAPDVQDLSSALGAESSNQKVPLTEAKKMRRSSSTIREEHCQSHRLGQARDNAPFLSPMKTSRTSSTALPELPQIVVHHQDQGSDKSSQRLARLNSLKKQLQSQWDQSNLEGVRKKKPEYETIKKDDGEDSDSSLDSSKQRLSPPTQVQSLSETSSSTGRSSSKVFSPSYSDDEESDVDLVVKQSSSPSSPSSSSFEEPVISRKKILAAVDKAGKHIEESQSQARLIQDDDDEAPETSSSSSVSNASLTEVEEVPEESKKGCETKEEEDNSKGVDSLDYLRKYGEVPRLMAGASVAPQKNEEEEESTSASILSD